MVSIGLKKITVMVLVASFCLLNVQFSTAIVMEMDGSNNSAGSSFSTLFSTDSGSSNGTNALIAVVCGLASAAPWARIFAPKTLSSEEMSAIERALKDAHKLFNWHFADWPNAGSAAEHNSSVRRELESDFIGGSQPLFLGQQSLLKGNTPADTWKKLRNVCDKEISELNVHIQQLRKVATIFADYDISATHDKNNHGKEYKKFISEATGQDVKYVQYLNQSGWTGQFVCIVNQTDTAAKLLPAGLVGSRVPWYGWGLRLIPMMLTAAITGNCLYGSPGKKIGLAYGLFTGLAWGMKAHFEEAEIARATELCWECIKKRERLQVIQQIAEQVSTQSSHPSQSAGSVRVNVNTGSNAAQNGASQ